LPPLRGDSGHMHALVVGESCLFSGGSTGNVYVPDSRASVKELKFKGPMPLKFAKDTGEHPWITGMLVSLPSYSFCIDDKYHLDKRKLKNHKAVCFVRHWL
jgi:hypothetical protein